jgi:hydroxyethylthiazole kinase-like uncharacterized protein yjeF
VLEPLYTADEMRAAEAGHDVDELMGRAARAVAEAALRAFPDALRFAAICGGGANGGDGRIAARLLREAGREVVEAPEGEPDVVIDALFGTGFRGEPRPEAARLIEWMNAADAPVVAVDVPSGVDASTGEVAGPAVRAALTVTFHGEKVGLRVAPGVFHAGRVLRADIGLEPRETVHARVTPAILRRVPRRGASDNKYTAGHVVVVGGSPGLTGAPSLTALAALRADAGYVTVVAPRESLPMLEARLLEAVKRPLEELDTALGKASAVAVGPGLGRTDTARDLVQAVLRSEVPAVVDADALFELEPFERAAPTILTPHAGELARLLGEESSWVDAHRLEAARRAVERFGCVVLLKGAGTIVAAPDAGPLVCPGTPLLATAGTGDVLTGIAAAFLAKGLDARTAAAAAATAQAEAAHAAGKPAGLIASDVAEALPSVL